MKLKRNTIQKKLIMDAVNSLCIHPTADEIYEYIVKDHPTISKGTVYRNLNTMCEEGSVYRVKVPGAPDRFDFTIDAHYHFVCEDCKRVFDVDMDYMSELEEKVPNNMGFIIKSHELIFSGVCKNCQQK
ncbi:MAG: transcriptional repressor [Clostridia bacterium]|nr:transcriptional repressor [Clostridia bacterium]